MPRHANAHFVLVRAVPQLQTGLDAPKEDKDKNDDQYRSQQTGAAMAKAIPVASEATAKAAEQGDHQND